MRRFRWTDLLNGHVIVLFVVQALGGVIGMAALDHDPGPFIGRVQEWWLAAPDGVTLLLSLFVVFAIPAVVLNVLVGVLLTLLGVQAGGSVPTLLFYGSAYLLAVGGAWAIRRHRTIVPEERVPVYATAVETSRWWYWIAAYVLYGVVSTGGAIASFWGYRLMPLPGTTSGALFVLVGAVAFVLSLAAVYVEGRGLRRAGGPWQPDYRRYLLGILVGNFVYPVGLLVAAYYLYRRRRHLGTP